MLPPSSIEELHGCGWIAFALGKALRNKLVDSLQICPGELNPLCAEILFQISSSLGSRNRHDILALRQYPGERKLRRLAVFAARKFLNLLYQIEVLLEVFSLKARRLPAKIVGSEVCIALAPTLSSMGVLGSTRC